MKGDLQRSGTPGTTVTTHDTHTSLLQSNPGVLFLSIDTISPTQGREERVLLTTSPRKLTFSLSVSTKLKAKHAAARAFWNRGHQQNNAGEAHPEAQPQSESTRWSLQRCCCLKVSHGAPGERGQRAEVRGSSPHCHGQLFLQLKRPAKAGRKRVT